MDAALRQASTIETSFECTCRKICFPAEVAGVRGPHATTAFCVPVDSESAVGHSHITCADDVVKLLLHLLRDTPAVNSVGEAWVCSNCRTLERRLSRWCDQMESAAGAGGGGSGGDDDGRDDVIIVPAQDPAPRILQPSAGALAHAASPAAPFPLQPKVDGAAMSTRHRRFTAVASVLCIELPAAVSVSSAIVGSPMSLVPLDDATIVWSRRREYPASPRRDLLGYTVVGVVGRVARGAVDPEDGNVYVVVDENTHISGSIDLQSVTVRLHRCIAVVTMRNSTRVGLCRLCSR